MPRLNLNLDDAILEGARRRAVQEGKTLEQVLADYLTTFAGDVTPPPSTAESTVAGSATNSYTVQRGDTLTKIARAVYGDPYLYPLIQQANNIDDAGRIYVGQVLVIPPMEESTTSPATPTTPPTSQPTQPQPTQPVVPTPEVDPCAPIPGTIYKLLTISSPTTDRPAPQHADLNLSMRGYAPTSATAGLIEIGGATDSRAPQLRGLFADRRIPEFPTVYRVYDWNWGQGPQGARAGLLSHYEVTLIGMQVTPGEIIYVPNAGYSIGEAMQVLVLYATLERVTIKYTREDNVIDGYTLHIEGLCVEPTLQAIYDDRDRNDRRQLVALGAGHPLGRAREAEIRVAIRDKGTFMDPRTRKDWWRST